MLILDEDFRQLIALRKLINESYDIRVDTCYSLNLAKCKLSHHHYRYLLINNENFSITLINNYINTGLFNGKVIFYNCKKSASETAFSHIFYLDGLPEKSVFDKVITATKQAKTSSFNERLLLQKALNSPDTIKFLFQPQYKKIDFSLHGFELFTRFSLDSVTLPTNKIISGLERNGLMAKFCDLFFSKLAACIDTFSECHLSLNLSLNAIEKLNLAKLIRDCLVKQSIKAEQITVEINEHDFMKMSEKAVMTLYQIRDLGCDICVEGLKTIWSPLPTHSHLINEIKIPINAYVFANIEWKTFMLDKLNDDVRLVVTNIENESQLNLLQNISDDFIVQGYYLSHPQDYTSILKSTYELAY